MSYPYIMQGSNIVVVIDNRSHTINKSHVGYDKIVTAIKACDWDAVRDNIEPKKVVLNYGNGFVSIQGDKLYWKGQEMHNSLSSRMISMLTEGFDIQPLVLFMENLMKNPSKRAVDELYGFMEKNNLPVTPDGYFLAFRRISQSWRDVHSGTVLNKPASLMDAADREAIAKPMGKKNEVTVSVASGTTIVSMERNMVNDNKDQTCSEGLHFCSRDYLNSFTSGRTIIVKISPADVVSIPSDYNNAKGRCCRYEIVSELDDGSNPDQKADNAFVAAVQSDARNTVAPNQEYDKFGRKLSMTKDAIRKRQKRAEEKDARKNAEVTR